MITRVTLQRTGCEGTCPVYTVAVEAPGRVHWQGQQFVARLGEHRWQLSPAQWDALCAAIDARDIHAYVDAYPFDNNSRTCQDDCITTITFADGREKRIAHHQGNPAAPRSLTAFEKRLDTLIGTAVYIGIDDERVPWRRKGME